MKLKSLKDLFDREVLELYRVNRDSLRMLSMLQRAAGSRDLSKLFEQEMSRASEHVQSLETLVGQQGTADCRPSRSVAKLFADCFDISRDEPATSALRDAALIATCQHLKHDLIAGFGCASAWARVLGDQDAVDILQHCAREVRESDRMLCAIADSINWLALTGQIDEQNEPSMEDTVLYCG